LFTVDFENILAVNNNPDFKIRLRFIGTNLTADSGNRVTFNNIAVDGVQIPLNTNSHTFDSMLVYPNPFENEITIAGSAGPINFKISSVDGKLIRKGVISNSYLNLSDLAKGLYLLQLEQDGNWHTKKIIKK
jgi:hypothetical protein